MLDPKPEPLPYSFRDLAKWLLCSACYDCIMWFQYGCTRPAELLDLDRLSVVHGETIRGVAAPATAAAGIAVHVDDE